jgi:threonine/homoserine/homoserine lactone efflux protein
MVTAAFVATSLVILLTPGPTNTMLATCGAAMGFRRGLIMPLAEAIGYLIAISFYVAFAQHIRADPTLFSLVKIIASVWLMYAALRLWGTVLEVRVRNTAESFLRILITTVVNPKAMLVGVILIPTETAGQPYLWIVTYAGLSIFAGTGWVLLGSLMPLNIRLRSYKFASLVLGFFSLTAAASAFSS